MFRVPDLLSLDSCPQRYRRKASGVAVLAAKDIFFFNGLSFEIEILPGTVAEVPRMKQRVKQILYSGVLDLSVSRIDNKMTTLFTNARIEQNLGVSAPDGQGAESAAPDPGVAAPASWQTTAIHHFHTSSWRGDGKK
jgi:hypothetical protein